MSHRDVRVQKNNKNSLDCAFLCPSGQHLGLPRVEHILLAIFSEPLLRSILLVLVLFL